MQAAAMLLRKHWPDIVFSSVYSTAAREVEDQADFLNAVAQFETDLEPLEVLKTLQAIEEELGKCIEVRFGPRTMDLDVLLFSSPPNPLSYGEGELSPQGGESPFLLRRKGLGDGGGSESTLILPHPRMHERRFVLQPLCELVDPAELHPTLQVSWTELLEKVNDQECEKVTSFELAA